MILLNRLSDKRMDPEYWYVKYLVTHHAFSLKTTKLIASVHIVNRENKFAHYIAEFSDHMKGAVKQETGENCVGTVRKNAISKHHLIWFSFPLWKIHFVIAFFEQIKTPLRPLTNTLFIFLSKSISLIYKITINASIFYKCCFICPHN